MPDAYLPETHAAQGLLQMIHGLQFLRIDFRAIGKTRGQAGKRRFLGRRQRQPPGQLADLILCQLALQQRTENVKLLDGPTARPVIVQVIHVRPVGNGVNSILRGDAFHDFKQFTFAEVAAVGGILLEVWDFELVGFDTDLTNANLCSQLSCLVLLVLRVRWRQGGYGQGTVAQLGRRNRSQEGTIDPTGKRDSQATGLPEHRFQSLVLRINISHAACLSLFFARFHNVPDMILSLYPGQQSLLSHMDASVDTLKHLPVEALLTISVVCCVLFVLGLAADVFLLVRFLSPQSRWRDMASRLRARPWSWREFALISLSLVALHATVASFLHELAAKQPEPADSVIVNGTVLSAAVLQGTALLLVLYVMVRRRLSPAEAFGTRLKVLPMDAAKGVLAYLAILVPIFIATFVYMIILHAFGYKLQQQAVVQILMQSRSPAIIAILGFLAIVAAPIIEEMIFRGIMLPFFARHMPVGTAVLTVSLLFALIHAHVPAIVPIFVLAVGLCLAYIVTGSLTVPVIMHACFNTLSLAGTLLLKDVVN